MAPLIFVLRKKKADFKICVTAQHREMLDQVLQIFHLHPDYDLNLMKADQNLNLLASSIFTAIDKVLEEELPNIVVVHGDTTTSAIIAQAAFHRRIKVAHIEAGLRTYDKSAPFPEEVNRQITARIADLHFTPTRVAARNLEKEGVSIDKIFVTGNTIVDALQLTMKSMNFGRQEIKRRRENLKLKEGKKLVLVTGHRRENFGQGLENICQGLIELSSSDEIQILYIIHLNPNVIDPINNLLGGYGNINLIDPQPYNEMLFLMSQAALIISDSGGIQEEAASLKIPLLITRNITERIEGVELGFSYLVGTNTTKIVKEAKRLLKNSPDLGTRKNPFGDGHAASKIVEALLNDSEENIK